MVRPSTSPPSPEGSRPGRAGRPGPAPLSEPHLGGSDGEGGVGQLLILRLLPGQSGSIFHLLELVGKLEKQEGLGHPQPQKLLLPATFGLFLSFSSLFLG